MAWIKENKESVADQSKKAELQTSEGVLSSITSNINKYVSSATLSARHYLT